MLEILYIIVMMLFLFGVTIFVHEFGHFIVARKCGLVVETFSIGMGPALWKKEIDGIVYKVGAFPIGGYVALPQLDPAGMEKLQGDNEAEVATYPEVSPWKKIAVSAAGPLFNILFALLLASIVSINPSEGLAEENGVFIGSIEANSPAIEAGLKEGDEIVAVNGKSVKSWHETQVECLLGSGDNSTVTLTVKNEKNGVRDIPIVVNHPDDNPVLIEGVNPAFPCQIEEVFEGSPAEKAGLLPNDILISINGKMTQGTAQFIQTVQSNKSVAISLTLIRDNEKIFKQVTPKYNKENDKVMIGIGFANMYSMPWALKGSPLKQIKSDASSIFRLLKALTTKGEAKQAASGLGGPIAIFTIIAIALKMGLINAIGLIRFININLAILNILPIPVLDGGHIVFALWEGITRRKIHPKVVMVLVNIFAILLISAMLILSWRDANRNWKINRIFNIFKKSDITQVVEQPTEK